MSNTQPPLLSVYDLRKEYDTKADQLTVLNGVQFSQKSGEMVFIIGRSGSGKSTFLHLLAGLDKPSSGKIVFEGEQVTSMKEKALAQMRNRRLGFVFQFYHLLPELTLYENVVLPTMIAGQRNDKWINEVLKRVGLTNRKDHYPSQLSGGEQQRAAIARALANHPALVLCDEPTGNLDTETAEETLSLIHDLNHQDGQSFLIVTHDEALAWRYENVYRLVDGVLIPASSQDSEMKQVQ